jgi:hypothetical protein
LYRVQGNKKLEDGGNLDSVKGRILERVAMILGNCREQAHISVRATDNRVEALIGYLQNKNYTYACLVGTNCRTTITKYSLDRKRT